MRVLHNTIRQIPLRRKQESQRVSLVPTLLRWECILRLALGAALSHTCTTAGFRAERADLR